MVTGRSVGGATGATWARWADWRPAWTTCCTIRTRDGTTAAMAATKPSAAITTLHVRTSSKTMTIRTCCLDIGTSSSVRSPEAPGPRCRIAASGSDQHGGPQASYAT